jgi:hypothetical protein
LSHIPQLRFAPYTLTVLVERRTGERWFFVMSIIARTLAVLSVLLTLVAIEIVHVQYLQIGFEATAVFGFYSLVLATVTALSALVIANVRARSGKRAGFSSTVVLSGISLLYVATLLAVGLAASLLESLFW